RFPHFLPDARHFTYAAVSEPAAIAIGSLDSSEPTRIVETDSEAWAPAGYLLFVRDTNLVAQPFDDRRLRLTGEATPLTKYVAEGGVVQNVGSSVSDTGLLAFVSGAAPAAQLTWLSRTGQSLDHVGAAGEYRKFSISPDGTRVVAERAKPESGQSEIWALDLSRGSELRLASTQAYGADPVWSPDGNSVSYDAFPPAKRQEHPYIASANGTGSARLVPVSRDFGSLVL